MEFVARCTRVGMHCFGDLQMWEVVAKLAPIGTMLIAVAAVLVAYRALRVQRDIARKRAAIDFFLKTEFEKAVVDATTKYKEGVKHLKQTTDIEAFALTDHFDNIMWYLNTQELVAVGIHSKIFDETICFEFWADDVLEAYQDCKPVIDFSRNEKGRPSPFSYVDLERLYNTWNRRDKRMQKRIKKKLG